MTAAAIARAVAVGDGMCHRPGRRPISTDSQSTRRAATLQDYAALVRRHKWLMTLVVVIVVGASLLLSLTQQTMHESESEVLLSRQNLAAQLTGTPQDPTVNAQVERFSETQAQLARVPLVVKRVLGSEQTSDAAAQRFLQRSNVKAQQNADLLLFSYRAPTRAEARRLVTRYAEEFIRYRRELDTAALSRARREVRARIAELRQRKDASSKLITNLVDKDQQLSTLQTLQTSNAFLIRPADKTQQVQPRPLRNTVLALVLGLILGLGAVFLREALDTRVRSGEELAAAIGLPLLGFLPAPPRKLEREGQLVALADPHGVNAEAFRVLRVNVDFARLERNAKTIVVTSAVQGEGKSVTAANLAITLARGGQRVTLIDLDLRRPRIASLFDLHGPGVTNVALDQVDLDDAIVQVPLDLQDQARFGGNGRQDGGMDGGGGLRVLTAGTRTALPAEFLGTRRLAEILAECASHADTVIIDSPPILRVGDAMALSPKVDALLFLARLDVVRRPMLPEVRRLLEASPVAKLGVVVASPRDDQSGVGYYGYGYGDDVAAEPAVATGRSASVSAAD